MLDSIQGKSHHKRGRFWLSFKEFVLLSLIISLHIYGIGVVEFYGLSIAPWDWLIFILACIWFVSISSSHRTISINGSLKPALILASLFTIWIGVCGFISPEPTRALTMLLMQIRNLFLFFLIGTLFSRQNLQSVNRKLLIAGSIIAAIALEMYVWAWFNYSEIISSEVLWKPDIAYNLDQGGALRLIGFAGDPNFYSLWIALPFFLSFSEQFSLKNILISVVIGLSIAMAMSRSFAIAFLISIFILFLVMLVTKIHYRSYIKRLLAGTGLATVAVIALKFIIAYDLSQFINRIQLAATTPRWDMWEQLKRLLCETWNPIIGLGSRGVEVALGGMYSHNTYIDILLETGLVGFLIWISLMIYITLCALKKLKQPELLPWIHTWIVLLVMYGAFSLAYNPFPWIIAGVLAASLTKQSDSAL